MKVCTHCRKQNPDDAGFCYGCGNPVKASVALPLKKPLWLRLPSLAWIIIGLAAIAMVFIIIVGGFVALATVEGIASILFFIIGCFTFRVFSGRPPLNSSFLRAVGIGFFALMGATVDQTGNQLYNKPVEWCYCDNSSSLNRSVDVANPLPGRTDITQDFTCWKNGKAVKAINPIAVMGIRFTEYALLAYGLLGLRWLWWRTRRKGQWN